MIDFLEYIDPETVHINEIAKKIAATGLDPIGVIGYSLASLREEAEDGRADPVVLEFWDSVRNWFTGVTRAGHAYRAAKDNEIQGDFDAARQSLHQLKRKIRNNQGAELPLTAVILGAIDRSIDSLERVRNRVPALDQMIQHYASSSAISGNRRPMMPTLNWQPLKRLSDDPREWDNWYNSLNPRDQRRQYIDRKAHDSSDREVARRGAEPGKRALFSSGGQTAPDYYTSDRWRVMGEIRRKTR